MFGPEIGNNEAAPREFAPLSEPARRPLDLKRHGKLFKLFLTQNPTVYHAVQYFVEMVKEKGFEELPARGDWTRKLEPGRKYYITRNGSSLIAFTVGEAYKPGNGIAMIAAHVDALTAKLKPVSNVPDKAGYVELGVAPYAGALNETWWDRDLAIAGRVIVRDKSTGKTSTKLVALDWPVAKIPTLAPHFGASMMGSNNKETQAVPVIGLETRRPDGKPYPDLNLPEGSFVSKQPPRLVELIGDALKVDSYDMIQNWDLELYDPQPATFIGMNKELLSGGRIDDKLCSWSAMTALIEAKETDDAGGIRLAALFDNEEIGSLTRQGAKGNFLPLVIERAVEALCASAQPKTVFGPGTMGRTYASSFLISADVTHAAHPNFLAQYQAQHAPRLNVGVAVCADSNGHMTTDGVSAAVLARVAQLAGCRTQLFAIRNDSRSGGTVGPSLSAMLGVKAADAGLPQLSMHSVRATTGADDPGLGVQFFSGFYENWERIDGEWQNGV